MIEKAFIHGNIYTSDKNQPVCQAIGITDGRFSFVGTNEEIRQRIEPETEVIDLNGSFVMAGITDGHCHVFANYLGKMMGVDLTQCQNKEEYITEIKKYVESHPKQKEIQGRGWVNSAFENMCPTKEMLEGIGDDRILCFRSMDGHSMWMNQYTLDQAGINKSSEEIAGGKIERNDNGTPNGCIRDAAMRYVQNILADFAVEQYKEVILKGQQHYASLGYTGYLEALINENYQENLHTAYQQLEAEGKLLLHSYSNFVILPGEDCLEHVEIAKQWKEQTKGKDYEVTSIKLFVDGVVEGATALLKEPYATDGSYYGSTRWDCLEQFEQTIQLANSLDIPVHVHSIGDQATKMVIDAIGKAQDQLWKKDVRNVIAHLQLVDKNDIKEMAKRNIMALFNPWCSKEPGFFEEAEVYYLSRERAEQEYLVKSFVDENVKCSFGTDFPLDSSCNPFVAMQVFAQRMNHNDPETLLNPAERIDIKTIIDIFTNGTAYQVGKESDRGSITVGKRADMVVLSDNLLEIEDSRISEIEPLMTIVNGKIVYQK